MLTLRGQKMTPHLSHSFEGVRNELHFGAAVDAQHDRILDALNKIIKDD